MGALDRAPELAPWPNWEQPFLLEVEVQNPAGEVLGRFKRSGTGFRVLLMNFVLEDAQGQPILFVRQPEPGFGWRRPLPVLDPGGSVVGELGARGAFFRETYLRKTTGEEITATMSWWVWKGYPIYQQGAPVAAIEILNPFFPTISRPRGVLLRFLPLSSPTARRFILLFAAYRALFIVGAR